MITRCAITYQPIPEGQKYSQEGLKKLSPTLDHLDDLPWSAAVQRQQARERSTKMSIQGVQPKLSAILNTGAGQFDIVDLGGRFILKPPLDTYPEVPENEDLSMKLAAASGIETPLHGMVYAVDGSRTYFIRRFDRLPKGQKTAMEDFAQLAGKSRETKYNFSMEGIVSLIETFCSFPVIEKKKLFHRTLFNFLIGNEDMHLKNFSVIRRDEKIELSPAYDFLNTTIVIGNAQEEMALPIQGRRRKLTKKNLIDYFAVERMKLNTPTIEEVLDTLKTAFPTWLELINSSFLSAQMKDNYLQVFEKHRKVLEL